MLVRLHNGLKDLFGNARDYTLEFLVVNIGTLAMVVSAGDSNPDLCSPSW